MSYFLTIDVFDERRIYDDFSAAFFYADHFKDLCYKAQQDWSYQVSSPCISIYKVRSQVKTFYPSYKKLLICL